MTTIGIYSFPKSGNTWLRSILAGLFDNRIDAIPGLHSEKLTAAEYARGTRFYKWHGDKPLLTHAKTDLATDRFIHIRRNPLDVFISTLNYVSGNVGGKAVIGFPSVEALVGTDLFDIYFHTFIHSGHIGLPAWANVTGTYYSHNRLWLDQARKSPHIRAIRYEDLMADPVQTLLFLTDWLSLTRTELAALIDNAAALTAIDGKFFWKQKVGNYLNYLTPAQIDLFLKYRLPDIAPLGYDAEFWAKTREAKQTAL